MFSWRRRCHVSSLFNLNDLSFHLEMLLDRYLSCMHASDRREESGAVAIFGENAVLNPFFALCLRLLPLRPALRLAVELSQLESTQLKL